MTVLFDPVKHEYHNELGVHFPSVTWLLGQAGICDYSFVQEEVRLRAMQRGRSVHWMTRVEDEGLLNYRTVPKLLRPYRKGYTTWKRNSGFVPEIIEEPFISEAWGFSGTPDRIGKFPPTYMFPRGSRAVVDLKTGAVCEWVKYQLVLYSVGITKHLWQAKLLRRIGLTLRADGHYSVKEFPATEWDHDFSIAIEAKKHVET